MEELTREEKHSQCMKEVRATLIAVAVCCAWHVGTAFFLNGSGKKFLGMPAWFSVSVLGTVVLSIVSVLWLSRKVFRDFAYDEECEEK